MTPASLHFGFLTVLHEPSGYLGGYLVMNSWGRPLEFRLSTAVQPNKVQQILYGPTLQSFLHADLIGKTLVEKTPTPVQLVITDTEPVLDLRQRLETPVIWLASANDPRITALANQQTAMVKPASGDRGPVLCHQRFPADAATARELLATLDSSFDLAEPFSRIREAMNEARRLGVTKAA